MHGLQCHTEVFGGALEAHVEDARRLVGAFEIFAQLVKAPSLSAQERPLGNAFESLAGFLDLGTQAGKVAEPQIAWRQFDHPVV